MFLGKQALITLCNRYKITGKENT